MLQAAKARRKCAIGTVPVVKVDWNLELVFQSDSFETFDCLSIVLVSLRAGDLLRLDSEKNRPDGLVSSWICSCLSRHAARNFDVVEE